MSTDRELLELAAKAAGVDLDLTIRPDGKALYCSDRGLASVDIPGWWGPLTKDGDAFRLAVTLRLNVYCPPGRGASASCYVEEIERCIYFNERDGDAAATRRAIVRAAAELWRQK